MKYKEVEWDEFTGRLVPGMYNKIRLNSKYTNADVLYWQFEMRHRSGYLMTDNQPDRLQFNDLLSPGIARTQKSNMRNPGRSKAGAVGKEQQYVTSSNRTIPELARRSGHPHRLLRPPRLQPGPSDGADRALPAARPVGCGRDCGPTPGAAGSARPRSRFADQAGVRRQPPPVPAACSRPFGWRPNRDAHRRRRRLHRLGAGHPMGPLSCWTSSASMSPRDRGQPARRLRPRIATGPRLIHSWSPRASWDGSGRGLLRLLLMPARPRGAARACRPRSQITSASEIPWRRAARLTSSQGSGRPAARPSAPGQATPARPARRARDAPRRGARPRSTSSCLSVRRIPTCHTPGSGEPDVAT